jgi:hypothetical protein
MLDRLSAVLGVILRGVFAAMLLVRRPRPIHPRGVVLEGEMTWTGDGVASGIRWIDEPPAAPVPVTARVSRSVGLPAPLPDVIGLALRIETEGGAADLEMSSSGVGVPGRFLLLPYRTPSAATYSTIVPYRGSAGLVMVCARSETNRRLPSDVGGIAEALRSEPWRVRLFAAMPTGMWRSFAEVTLRTAAEQDDHGLRFDAVRRPLPGGQFPRWVRVLRQPSYRYVQRPR